MDRGRTTAGRPVEAVRARGALPAGIRVPVRAPAAVHQTAQLTAPDSSRRRRATRRAGCIHDRRGCRVHPGGVGAGAHARRPGRARDDGRGGGGEGGGRRG